MDLKEKEVVRFDNLEVLTVNTLIQSDLLFRINFELNFQRYLERFGRANTEDYISSVNYVKKLNDRLKELLK